MVKVKKYLGNGIDILELENEKLHVEVTNFGCTMDEAFKWNVSSIIVFISLF